MDSLIHILDEFFDLNAAVIMNEGKLCGAALGDTLYEACVKAFDCDPVNACSGVIGFSKPLDAKTEKYLSSIPTELILPSCLTRKKPDLLKVLTKTKPQQTDDAIFAWNIVKHLEPGAILAAKGFKILACDVESVCEKDAVLALNQPVTEEIIYAAAQSRISLIVQTGNEFVQLADKYNIAMLYAALS